MVEMMMGLCVVDVSVRARPALSPSLSFFKRLHRRCLRPCYGEAWRFVPKTCAFMPEGRGFPLFLPGPVAGRA
jgi:hypothetical protein